MKLDDHLKQLSQTEDTALREASLAAFHDAAAAGEDLGPYVEGLLGVLESRVPWPIEQGLWRLLVRHYLMHDSDGSALIALMQTDYLRIKESLQYWAETEGLDTSLYFPVIVEREPLGAGSSPIKCLLQAHLVADRKRWPATLSFLQAHPEIYNSCWRRVAMRCIEGVWTSESPWPAVLPWLFQQISTDSIEVQKVALGTLKDLVDRGLDLTLVVPEIEKFLKNPHIRRKTKTSHDLVPVSAYLLTRHLIREGRFSEIHTMASTEENHRIRNQVQRALYPGLIRDQFGSSELLDCMVGFLVDPKKYIRWLALDQLKRLAELKRQAISPGEPAVRALVPALAHEIHGQGVAEYLALLIGQDPAWRERLVDWAAEAKVSNVGCAVDLLGATSASAKCDFCIVLKRGYSTRAGALYEAQTKMLHPNPMEPGSRGPYRCPDCGDWYLFWEWAEDRGYSDDLAEGVTLARLSPADALDHLSGSDLAEWEAGYEVRLQRSQDGLSHPQSVVKKEAAWELTRHCLQMGDLDGLRALLEHHSDVVRNETVRTIRRAQEPSGGGGSQMKYDPLIVDITSLAEPLKRLRKSEDHHAREAAKWLLARADD